MLLVDCWWGLGSICCLFGFVCVWLLNSVALLHVFLFLVWFLLFVGNCSFVMLGWGIVLVFDCVCLVCCLSFVYCGLLCLFTAVV